MQINPDEWEPVDESSGGILEPGNIDLDNRPSITNPDGSISTIRSISTEIDGRQILIPTVAHDGSRILDDKGAIEQYQKSGKHLGIFNSIGAANAHAQRLHEQQAQSIDTVDPAKAQPIDDESYISELATRDDIDEVELFRVPGMQDIAARVKAKRVATPTTVSDVVDTAAKFGKGALTAPAQLAKTAWYGGTGIMGNTNTMVREFTTSTVPAIVRWGMTGKADTRQLDPPEFQRARREMVSGVELGTTQIVNMGRIAARRGTELLGAVGAPAKTASELTHEEWKERLATDASWRQRQEELLKGNTQVLPETGAMSPEELQAAGSPISSERIEGMSEYYDPSNISIGRLAVKAGMKGVGVGSISQLTNTAGGYALKGIGKTLRGVSKVANLPNIRGVNQIRNAAVLGSAMAGNFVPLAGAVASKAGKAVAERAGQRLERVGDEMMGQAVDTTQSNLGRILDRSIKGATAGTIGGAGFALGTETPEQAGAQIATGTSLGGTTAGLAETGKAGRRIAFDPIFKTTATPEITTPVPAFDYQVDPELDAAHNEVMEKADPQSRDEMNRLRSLMRDSAEIYELPADKFDKLPEVQGQNVQGVYVRERAGERPTIFVKEGARARWHEVGHPFYDMLSTEAKQAIREGMLSTNDPGAMASAYESRLQKKPTEIKWDELTPERQEHYISEMAAEQLQAVANGLPIDQLTKDPSQLRKIRMGIGQVAEKLGLGATEDVATALGVQPSLKAALLMERALRDKASFVGPRQASAEPAESWREVKKPFPLPKQFVQPAQTVATAPTVNQDVATASDALVTLGYSKSKASEMAKSAFDDGAKTPEEIVAKATQKQANPIPIAAKPETQAMPSSEEYKGYKIYFPRSGSNSGLKSVKARNESTGDMREIVLPDSGMSRPAAIRKMREQIDENATFMPATRGNTIDRPASKINDLIFPGTRPQAIKAAKKFGLEDLKIEDGFATGGGRWVNPEEARALGEDTGQLPEGARGSLTPEDLANQRRFMPTSSRPDALDKPAMRRKSDGKVFVAKDAATPHWMMARENPELQDRFTLGGVDRYEDGWVTNNKEFLDKKQGHARALKTKQIDKDFKTEYKGGLSSLDLREGGKFMPSDHPDAINRAAMKMPDGKIYKGATHYDAIKAAEKDGRDFADIRKAAKGFTTATGRFLDTDGALAHALRIKQLTEEQYTEAEARQGLVDKPGTGEMGLESLAFWEARQFMPAVPKAQSSAETYVKKSGIGKILLPSEAQVDVERAKKIAQDFESLPKADDSPETRKAYETFAKEIDAQYRHAVDSGMEFEFTKSDPYKTSAEMTADVEKGRLKVYTGGDNHPFLGSSTKDENGLTANEKFRAVHDLYGHASEGNQFGPQGEERAWRKHAAMFSDEARSAMTAETRGQNSWVNYGPHMFDENGWKGDKSHPNYIPPDKRPFAEQKASLLPKEHSSLLEEAQEATIEGRREPVARPNLSGVSLQPTPQLNEYKRLNEDAGPNVDSPAWVHEYFALDKKKNPSKEESSRLDELHQLAEKTYGTYDKFYQAHGGRQYRAEDLFKFMPSSHPDAIVSPAVKESNGEVKKLRWHYEVDEEPGQIDGFVTRTGRFLDREEALRHARAINQTREGFKGDINERGNEQLESIIFKSGRQFMPSTDPRAVKEAAVRDSSGKTWTGLYHADAVDKYVSSRASGETPKDKVVNASRLEQGFVTNTEEFLNRVDAEARAAEVGQLQHNSLEGLEAEDFEQTRRFMPSSYGNFEQEHGDYVRDLLHNQGEDYSNLKSQYESAKRDLLKRLPGSKIYRSIKSDNPDFESPGRFWTTDKSLAEIWNGGSQYGAKLATLGRRTVLEKTIPEDLRDVDLDATIASHIATSENEVRLAADAPSFMPGDNPRAIDQAAIKMPDGMIYKGRVHADASQDIYASQRYTDKEIDVGAIYGFVDREGKFLTRQEAETRAAEVGQLQYDSTEGLEAINFNDTRRFMPAPNEMGFYSKLEDVLESKMSNRASIEQIRGLIKSSGVKAEELKWTGLDDFLAEQEKLGPPVTKKEILDYVRANNVQVEEVIKGESKRSIADKKYDRAFNALKEAHGVTNPFDLPYRIEEGAIKESDPKKARLYQELHDAHVEAESMYSEKRSPDETKFSQHVLPGGEEGSYRELLLIKPPQKMKTKMSFEEWQKERGYYETDNRGELAARRKIYDQGVDPKYYGNNEFKGGHWDEPNVLAHVRFDTRISPDGSRTLHIAEIQSDAHQLGRKHGYKTGEKGPYIHKLSGDKFSIYDADDAMIDRGLATLEEAQAVARKIWHKEIPVETSRRDTMVPDMPFKTSWPALAMKRMIRYASENGYDRISWDTGATQAERYGLSKFIDNLEVYKTGEGTYSVRSFPTQGATIADIVKSDLTESKLADTIEKDLAEKAVKDLANKAPSENDPVIYSDLDLKVGSSGMSGFYDKILPSVANDLGKKFGIRVGEGVIATKSNPYTYKEIGPTFEDVGPSYEWDIFKDGKRSESFFGDQEAEADVLEYVESLNDKEGAPSNAKSWQMDITPQMRESVTTRGQPLFQPSTGSNASAISAAKGLSAISLSLKVYETELAESEEEKFMKWKARVAPNDSGEDYDWRGAFKSRAKPDKDGHWPDKFKKPNHPTFSVESIYAKDRPELAGRWKNGKFIPPKKKAKKTLKSLRNLPSPAEMG